MTLASGCSFPALRAVAPDINATLSPQAFVVAGDTIGVRFPQKPEWDHQTIVRDDGRATFTFVGELQLVGLSVGALGAKVSEAYANQSEVGAGTVSVDIIDPAPREVTVIGEVNIPGVVAFGRGELTFLEAIGRAGGPVKGSALLEEAMLIRWLPVERRHQVWQFDAGLDNWVDGTPVFLQPHDVIYVPNNMIDKINVWVDKYIRQNLPLPIAFPVGNF